MDLGRGRTCWCCRRISGGSLPTDRRPFNYAFSVHGNVGFDQALAKSGSYLLGLIGYAALPCVVYWLVVRPNRATIREASLPADPERRMLVALFVVPLLLPAIMAPLLKTSVTPLWTMQAWFLLPILLLAPRSAVLPRRAMITTAICVFVATLRRRRGRPRHRLALSHQRHRHRTASTRTCSPSR